MTDLHRVFNVQTRTLRNTNATYMGQVFDNGVTTIHFEYDPKDFLVTYDDNVTFSHYIIFDVKDDDGNPIVFPFDGYTFTVPWDLTARVKKIRNVAYQLWIVKNTRTLNPDTGVEELTQVDYLMSRVDHFVIEPSLFDHKPDTPPPDPTFSPSVEPDVIGWIDYWKEWGAIVPTSSEGMANIDENGLITLTLSTETGRTVTVTFDAPGLVDGEIPIGFMPTGNTTDRLPLIKGTIAPGETIVYSQTLGGFIGANSVQPKGTITSAELDQKTATSKLGDVWNLSDERTFDGITYKAGTDWILSLARNSTPENPVYVWEPLTGVEDLDAYQLIANMIASWASNVDNDHYPTAKLVKDSIDDVQTDLDTHKARTDNPHSVTKAQVGLGNVENYPIDQTPTEGSPNYISSGAAYAHILDPLNTHVARTDNPHSVTKAQTGLGNVENRTKDVVPTPESVNYVSSGGAYSAIQTVQNDIDAHELRNDNPHNVTKSQVGLGSVVNLPMDSAPTDGSPNYVTSDGIYDAIKVVQDDVNVHEARTDNPHSVTKAQVGLGSVENHPMDSTPTNGSENYVTSDGIYDAIKVVQDDVDAHEARIDNPHSVTKVQVGLGNVDNTSDANKPVSTAQQAALDLKLDDSQLKTTWSATVSDSNIPSEKLTKDTLDTKVDKVTHQTGTYVYANDTGQKQLEISSNADATTVAYRGSNGTLNVGTPTADAHASTKKYTDDQDATKVDKTSSASKVYVTDGTGAQATLGYSTMATASNMVQRQSNSQITVPQTPAADTDATSKKYVEDRLSAEVTTLVTRISGDEADIDAIEAKIPAQATSSNQLADKEFVRTTVATNAAEFLGTYSLSDLGLTFPSTNAQISTALGQRAWSPAPTVNDYVFVSIDDPVTQGVDENRRFKYTSTGWLYEYTLNNSAFTTAQWAAINSGIDSTKRQTYDDYSVTKQDTLIGTQVTGQNIKSINSASILGTGNIELQTPLTAGTDYQRPMSPGTLIDITNDRISVTGLNWGVIGGTLSNQTDLQTALNGKVDKLSTASKVYVTDGSGAQSSLSYGTNATASNIVQRGASGEVTVPQTPTADTQAASKKYVDDQDATKVDKVTHNSGLYAYVNDTAQGQMLISREYSGDAIVRWTADGNINVATPTANSHAATKKYVDDVDATKLDMVTSTAVDNRVYGVSASGVQTMYRMDVDATANSIPWREVSGTVKVGTPTIDAHAATKKYVDDGLALKQPNLVSGTNIKTYNGQSILGSGNLDVDSTLSTTSTNAVQNRTVKNALDLKTDILMAIEDWDSSLTYPLGATVVYDGKIYISLAADNESATTDTTKWRELGHKGDKGDTGDTGRSVQGEISGYVLTITNYDKDMQVISTTSQNVRGAQGIQGVRGYSVQGVLENDVLTITNYDSDMQVLDTQSQNVRGPMGYSIPVGGTTGQYLIKNSDDNYDYAWMTPSEIKVNTVNGMDGDVVLDADDVGALPDDTTYVSTLNGNSGAVTLKTINSEALDGSGDIALQVPLVGSGTGQNIKTINGASLLGSGNIAIPIITVDSSLDANSTNPVQNQAIAELIPNAASFTNQLADKAFVNSSITTATSNFLGTYDIVDDLHLTASDMSNHSTVAAAIASEITFPVGYPTNNDYVFIELSAEDAGGVGQYDRYKYTGSGWTFEYTLNNSSFTADQWAAINSTITSTKVETYDAYALLKQDRLVGTPTAGQNIKTINGVNILGTGNISTGPTVAYTEVSITEVD